MGICTNKPVQYKSPESQSPKCFEKGVYDQKPITTPNSLLNQLTDIRSQLEPKEYDYSNPHKQYNVLIDGVLFDVVNSMEGPLDMWE